MIYTANNSYSLWRANGSQPGFRLLASLGFGGKCEDLPKSDTT
jgi:hypothetical protein